MAEVSRLSQFHGPGYFYVLSQPTESSVTEEYHQWYNDEHGPLRLKLDFILNGYRYKSLGVEPPVYLASYDLARVSGLQEPRYTVLREKRSEREIEVLATTMKKLDRRIYADLSSRGQSNGPAPIIMTVILVVKDEHVDLVNRWYEEEHTEDISKIPGWRRTRRFELVEGDGQNEGYTELLAVHDFDMQNGLDGPEHERAKSRSWRKKVMELVESRENTRFEFFHEFAARDYRPPTPVPTAVISDEKVSANTGATSWRLEGPDDGPVVILSNSLLTDLHIWDLAMEKLRARFPRFRWLRYNTRGYEAASQEKVTVDLLADDLALLLDHLGIEKCFSVVGVSLGGVTALNFALRYPQRLETFVSCDCNVQSSAANTQTWRARLSLAHSEGGWEKLADQTVNRWFTPASVKAQAPGVSQVRRMITAGSQAGFENCVGALCDFDLMPRLGEIATPGYCVAGAQDGALPETMERFSKDMKDAYFTEIPGAGHLPMVENPEAFVRALTPLFEQYSRRS